MENTEIKKAQTIEDLDFRFTDEKIEEIGGGEDKPL